MDIDEPIRTGTLHFFTGKMGAGKSTLAAGLTRDMPDALSLAEDELLAVLYPGEVTDVASYVRCSTRVQAAIGPALVATLRAGGSLVLDFPANTRARRRWMRELIEASGCSHELHLIDCPDATCRARVAARGRPTDTPAMFDAMGRHFELPADDEGFTCIAHTCRSHPDA